MDPGFLDITTEDGYVVRIVYQLTLGDLVVSSLLALLILYFLLAGIMKTLWRR